MGEEHEPLEHGEDQEEFGELLRFTFACLQTRSIASSEPMPDTLASKLTASPSRATLPIPCTRTTAVVTLIDPEMAPEPEFTSFNSGTASGCAPLSPSLRFAAP